MAGSRARSALRTVRDLTFSVRGRTTVMTTLVVGVVLIVAGFALISLQRRALTDNIDTTIRLRSADITTLISGGAPPDSIAVSDAEAAFVQVVDERGNVTSASYNIVGLPPITDVRPPVGESAIVGVPKVPVDDEPFRVLARTFESDGGAYTVYVGGSLEQVEESTASLLVLLRFGIPLLLLGVAAGTWMLVGRALAPVESIRAEVAEISGHESGRRVPEPSTLDEIGRLARTMNEMLARIDEAQDRQRRFVADASHELRSPLATMRAQLEVDETHPETAAWETTSKDLHEEIVRMQRLVDELLFLARSDASRLAQRRPVDLDDIVIDEVRRARASSPVTIDSSAVSAGQVSGDHDQLRRVVRNLLDNALEHARCAVAIRLGEDGERVTLVVDDDGEGIPVESREQVFERFVRLDGARTPGRGGIGLGLAISRAIVEAHGGSITVSDGALGGARFIVTFPAAWAAPRARAGGERTGQASSAGFQPE